MTKLREPVTVRYEVEADGGKQRTTVASVSTLGRLPSAQESLAVIKLRDASRLIAERIGHAGADFGEIDSTLKDYKALGQVARHNAAAVAMENGNYWTFEAASEEVNEARIPKRYHPVRLYNIGELDGKRVDVLVPVPLNDPEIEGIDDACRDLSFVKTEMEAEEFNRQPYEVRALKIEKHYASIERLGALTKTKPRPADFDAQLAGLSEALISKKFEINRTSMILGARRDR